ncbi:hypothetical protein Lser_V15G28812 [Lactuca serriola]
MAMVGDVSFPPHITTTKPLSLVGHGITEVELHSQRHKFTAVGVYIDPKIITHLQQWKGKSGMELAEDNAIFDRVISAPVDKYLRIVVTKEIKGIQYGVELVRAVKDKVVAEHKYGDEEDMALVEIMEFFPFRPLNKDSVLTFSFLATSNIAEIGFSSQGYGDDMTTMKVLNRNVVEAMKKWYLGGTKAYSPSTILSLANTLASELSK